jgi:hypothetical protein
VSGVRKRSKGIDEVDAERQRESTWVRLLPWLDVVVVLGFVIVGRDSHELDGGFVDVLRVAAPFLAGVAVGRIVAGSRWNPVSVPAGVVVVLCTVGIGMILRGTVFGDGTAATFIAVAAAFFGAGMLGWRLVVWRMSAGGSTRG